MSDAAAKSVRSGPVPRILVTGASGRIGGYVLDALKHYRCAIRAVTSRPLTAERGADPHVEWVQHDFMRSAPVDHLVAGCDAVLHLAGEVWNIPRMQRVNVEASGALARAARHGGIRFFGFTSSIAVYGTPRTAFVSEDAPLLTPERDVRAEYRGNTSLRAYGRSKVLAEREIAAEAVGVECVILRPTFVADDNVIRRIVTRRPALHFIMGRRHEHLICVEDVAAALVWFLDRSLRRTTPQTGVETYNLADDQAPQVTGAALRRVAYDVSSGSLGRHWWACGPLWLYDLAEALKYGRLSARPTRDPIYSTAKLYAAGYVRPVGLEAALVRACRIGAPGAAVPGPEWREVPAASPKDGHDR